LKNSMFAFVCLRHQVWFLNSPTNMLRITCRCFLVTYYFTQRLLPKMAASRSRGEEKSDENNVLVDFVKNYGAYVKLHTCLAYAAALKCSDVIHELLELSEHDMRHREVIKLFAKRNALILYEPTMLSAIVKCLPLIRKEPSAERRQTLVDTCVSAYPDLLPWQVKQALIEPQGNGVSVREDMKELYYYYLSSLLYPLEGSEVARRDPGLVEVSWCFHHSFGCHICLYPPTFGCIRLPWCFFSPPGMVHSFVGRK